MLLLVSSWNDVSKTNIVNCFRKENISESSQSDAVNDEDDAFKELNEDLDELRNKDPSLVPEEITAEILTATDDDVVTTASLITDEEILEEVNQENTGEDVLEVPDDELDEEVFTPTIEVENALEVLHNLSLFSDKRGNEMQDLVHKFQSLVCRDKLEKKKQSSILNFFVQEK